MPGTTLNRNIPPQDRKRIRHEDLLIRTKEKKETNRLELECKLTLTKADYPDKAEIILEAYNRINILRIKLGPVSKYKEEEKFLDLDFPVPLRAKINYRLKIIDPESYKLLGYAEGMKEEKYAKSLLSIETGDDKVKNIYRIDFDNLDHPILFLNPKLARYADSLKPFLAEMALKDILNYLVNNNLDNEEFKEHKWFKFANHLVPYPDYGEENKPDWINQVLNKFSEKKVISRIEKIFN